MTDSSSPSPELKGERPSISSLQLYLDGEGPEFLRQEVAVWVESCPETRADFERLQAISLGLRDLPELTAPEGVKSRVLDRIRDRTRDVAPPSPEPTPIVKVEPLPASRWSGLLAASVLVGIIAGLWFTADQWREWLPNAAGPELAKSNGDLEAKPGRSGELRSSADERSGNSAPAAKSEEPGDVAPGSPERSRKAKKGLQSDGSVTLSESGPATGAKPPTPAAIARPVVVRGHPSKTSLKDAPHAYYALTIGPSEISSREWAATLLGDLAAETADDEAVSMLIDFEFRRALPDPSDAAYQELRVDVPPDVRIRLDLLAAQNAIGDDTPFAMRSGTTSASAPDTPNGDDTKKADDGDEATAKKTTPTSRDLAERDSPRAQKSRSRGSRQREAGKPSVTARTDDTTAERSVGVTLPPKVRVHLRLIAPKP
ncbi:MAG: hypothetical protein AAF488_17980 [Planctomycetota bacterium]